VEFHLETKEAQEWCDSAAVARSSSCQTDIVSTRDIGSTESDKRGNSEAEFQRVIAPIAIHPAAMALDVPGSSLDNVLGGCLGRLSSGKKLVISEDSIAAGKGKIHVRVHRFLTSLLHNQKQSQGKEVG